MYSDPMKVNNKNIEKMRILHFESLKKYAKFANDEYE